MRSEKPPTMKLMKRDIEVLRCIYEEHYLTSEHIYQLVFKGTGKRVCFRRLRLLWEHHFLEKIYIPVILTGKLGRQNNRDIYSLTRQGFNILKGEYDEIEMMYTPKQTTSYTFLSHHLIVVDMLVALRVSAQEASEIQLLGAEHEALMRQKLKQWRGKARGRTSKDIIVSDGIFSFRYLDSGKTKTFHIEIVRADIRGGNNKLLAKLILYFKLHRDGFFKKVYGQENIRAIIIVTTSQKRADNLQVLASTLPHGKRFFWFGSYDEESSAGAPLTSLKASSILTKKWIDGEGESHCILDG